MVLIGVWFGVVEGLGEVTFSNCDGPHGELEPSDEFGSGVSSVGHEMSTLA